MSARWATAGRSAPFAPGWAAVLAIFIGAVQLLSPAIVNGFPFIFPDSGDYLVLHPLLYRAPYYGLFFRILSFNRYIWIPIFIQALIISGFIWKYCELVVRARMVAAYFVVILLLSVASSLPFFVGFILADIFTSVMFLSVFMLYFYNDKLSNIELVVVFLAAVFSISAHATNLILSIGLLGLFLLLALGRRQVAIGIKPFGLVAAPIALAACAILLFNGVIFRDWSIAPAGQSFMLANMIEYGPARDYLREACPTHHYKICAYRDELPATAEELLWTTGLFEKLGGFPAMKDEARQIVVQTAVTHPTAVARMVTLNFAHALLTHAPCAECRRDPQVPSFANLLDMKYGPNVRAAYENSAEMRNALPYEAIKALDWLVFPISMVALMFFAWRMRVDFGAPAFSLAISVWAFILGDTLLCSAISGVHDRYQARVTWLAPMAVALFILRAFTQERDRKRSTPPPADPISNQA